MKHIPYRQNPTVIDTSKKARPPPGADRPKTQKSILKVGNNIQNMIANKNKIDEMNGYDISLDAKVENDGRSETVFGQSGGI